VTKDTLIFINFGEHQSRANGAAVGGLIRSRSMLEKKQCPKTPQLQIT
jgi:hypothetical protein